MCTLFQEMIIDCSPTLNSRMTVLRHITLKDFCWHYIIF